MAISFMDDHVPPDVILMGVRWYVAYPLITRHVEELMEERGVELDHATINPSMWPQLSSPFEGFFVFSCLYRFPYSSYDTSSTNTGIIHEEVGFSPHSPCDGLCLLYTAHAPLSSAGSVPLLGRRLTDSRRCWVPLSRGLCTRCVLLAS